jgi:biotin transport system substrate-specific component
MNLALLAAPRRRALARFWGLALLGSAVLAASAQVALPAWPVPATLQSLAVLLLGALGGARLGTAAVALYLLEGALLGLPVFAGGNAGPAALAGPTGGYLLGFLPAAWAAGHARGPLWRQGAVLLAAHLLLFAPGVAWLAGFVGAERAFAAGFLAFLPATLVKTALALAALRAVRR